MSNDKPNVFGLGDYLLLDPWVFGPCLVLGHWILGPYLVLGPCSLVLPPMTLAIAIISLITAAIPLIIWYVKRKHSPTPQEQLCDTASEFEQLRADLADARARGDDAGAESVLRRLRARAGLAGGGAVAAGQRGGDDAAGGNGAGNSGPGGQ